MRLSEEQYLAHYGILRRSGRYPWGSSNNESKRNRTFLDTISQHQRDGMTETEIVKYYDLPSTTALRAAKTIAINEQKQSQIGQAQRLKDKGNSYVGIGKRMNLPESTVRSLLAPGAKEKADILLSTANMLEQQVKEKTFVDVGSGIENQLNVSPTKLNAAVAILVEKGYSVHPLSQPQVTTKNRTKFKVLVPPGVTKQDVWANKDKISQIHEFTKDGGETWTKIQPPIKINPKRVAVTYGSEGGAKLDGVLFVRPGVEDVALGNSRYAQVRVMVGDKHYLKGMAMYKDDLPDGVDIMFNTNKESTGKKTDVFKEVELGINGEIDEVNPFGSDIKRQVTKRDSKGNEVVTSSMNIVNEEGAWLEWNSNLSSQMLSKQTPGLARAQLALTYERRLKEFNELNALTNPEVRKKLLESFGDETTKAAVQLKAAALNGRQNTHVILPINSLADTEVYAPNYENGERVVLIRHPHAGTFEIPELTVNNKHPEAKRLLGDARDAIGINSNVAERLSGADFDGDAVIVIPNGSNKIKSTPALQDLRDFDPRASYPPYEGMRRMSSAVKGHEMGLISNLITDMTIRKASASEMARAVKHSMVVIDAEKHNLNWKESHRVNGIADLNEKYQNNRRGGSSTLLSRARGEARVPQRIDRPASQGGPIDKATGKRVYVETGRSYTDSKGRTQFNTTKSTKLAETDDANTLSSGTQIERIYAEHSNRLKELGNRARKESVNTRPSKYDPGAAKTYASEVASLNSKLALVIANRPLERQAQLIADGIVKAKKQTHPNMDADDLTKVKNRAIATARNRTGAKGAPVVIEKNEWEAIQAGAISPNKLNAILAKADLDVVRDLATPRTKVLMTNVKTERAKQMLASGYTRGEVAAALGVSLSTLDNATLD